MLTLGSLYTAIVAFVCCACPLPAQLTPYIQDVVNSYSFIPQGVPNYGIAQGSIFTLFGSNMSRLTQSQGVPLESTLAGVSVNIVVGGTTLEAIPYFVSPGQINAILPSRTPLGDGTVTVTFGGQAASAPIHVVRSAFGLLRLADANAAVVQNASQGGELLSQSNAANPGEYLVLWGAGLGGVTADETQYQVPGNLNTVPIEVDIGGVSATVTYKGRSIYPGLDQINVMVPPGVSGCYVSLMVTANGTPSNVATIPVAPSGRMCSDNALVPGSPADYQRLLSMDNINVGVISLSKLTTFDSTNGPTAVDSAYALLQRYTGQQLVSGGFLLQASIGSCVAFNDGGPPPYFRWSSPAQLNAGPDINLRGPDGLLTLAPRYPGYAEPVGASPPIIPLTGGIFEFDNGSGGPDVAPFSGTLNVSVTNPLIWTNRSIGLLNRANDLLITWTGGIPGSYVSIFGYSSAHEYSPLRNGSDVYTYFTCNAPVSAGQFAVPASVLKTLLPTGAALGPGLAPAANGYLYVVNGITQQFSASGLDLGFVSFGIGSGISVPFN